MSKNKKRYICSECGSVFTKWLGQCPDCLNWNSVEEEYEAKNSSAIKSGNVMQLEKLDNNIQENFRISTPINELNIVLGGGLVPGSAILIGGDPGIGKSTLLLQLAANITLSGSKSLYVTGEESINQVKLRAMRLGLASSMTNLIAASNVYDIIATIDKNKNNLDLVIIDSIQTMYVEDVSSTPGTISQIKASAHELINYAKSNHITLIIVGHVTKDGQIAGPKILEHMVDTVLYFEGDSSYQFRILRSIKNRFGGVNEIGVFEMRASGLVEITNPSELFLMDRDNNVVGSSIFAGIEGSRPVLVEVQALVSPSHMATPRRSVVGWDPNRLSMILAVLSVRYGINLANSEVYLTIAGGLKITEPAADLAVAAAIISAVKNKPIDEGTVFFGEVGLSGEIRKVSQSEQRIKEAEKLGFSQAFCNFPSDNFSSNVNIRNILHIKQVL